ncbi:MAG: PD-(D/E)XK nuclease domain-containing protein [Anaerolineae bacterium]
MPEHPETLAVLAVLRRAASVPYSGWPRSGGTIGEVLGLLKGEWFSAISGYYCNHRPAGQYGELDAEWKVQDLVYCLLYPVLTDLHYEDPHPKTTGAIASTRIDFASASTGIWIEVKLATRSHPMRDVEKEIDEDITKYGRQGGFSSLVFFVYCCGYRPQNPREFERGLTGAKEIDANRFHTYCVVRD